MSMLITNQHCQVSDRRGFLLGFLGTTAFGSSAFADPLEFPWKHPGGAPAFKTREAAMAARYEVFTKFGYAPDVAKRIIAAMDTMRPGVSLIRKGVRFDHMLSSHMRVHAPTVAAFESSFENLKYSDGEYVIKAQFWLIKDQGKQYNIYLPNVCHNWSDIVTMAPASAPAPKPPAPTHEDCVFVRVALRDGDRLLSGIAIMDNRPLIPSPCFAQLMPGEIAFEKNFSMDACGKDCSLDRPVYGSVDENGKPIDMGRLIPEMQNSFVAQRSGWYTFRLPHYFAETNSDYRTVFCLEGFDGKQAAHYIGWHEFALDPADNAVKAYIAFEASEVSKTWTGKRPIIWESVRRYPKSR